MPEMPDADHVVPRTNSRNTRRWCRGRTGIEHTWEWQKYRVTDDPAWPWEIQICKACGRHGKVRDLCRLADALEDR